MRKGLANQISRSLTDQLTALEPSWTRAGTLAARRTGAWVQVVQIEVSRWADQFLPSGGVMYLRSWDPEPHIGMQVLARRLRSRRHRVDDWVTESRWVRESGEVMEQLRSELLPRIDEPLVGSVTERLVEEHAGDADWYDHHVLCFIAADRLDRGAAERHLVRLEAAAAGFPVEPWVDAARSIVDMIDRPDEVQAYLDEIQEARLASIKSRPLG